MVANYDPNFLTTEIGNRNDNNAIPLLSAGMRDKISFFESQFPDKYISERSKWIGKSIDNFPASLKAETILSHLPLFSRSINNISCLVETVMDMTDDVPDREELRQGGDSESSEQAPETETEGASTLSRSEPSPLMQSSSEESKLKKCTELLGGFIKKSVKKNQG